MMLDPSLALSDAGGPSTLGRSPRDVSQWVATTVEALKPVQEESSAGGGGSSSAAAGTGSAGGGAEAAGGGGEAMFMKRIKEILLPPDYADFKAYLRSRLKPLLPLPDAARRIAQDMLGFLSTDPINAPVAHQFARFLPESLRDG